MIDESGSDQDFRTSFLDAEQAYKPIESGAIVRGEVIQVTADDVVIDVGLKGEGRIRRAEFRELGEEVRVGDKVEVKVLSIDGEEGGARLSRLRAVQDERWTVVNEAFKNKTPIEGTVIGEVKGGFKVELGLPYTGFLPHSQAALKRRITIAELEGQKMFFEIRELDRRRKNIVLSRRTILETEQSAKRGETLKALTVGTVVDGVVKNITSFGVFVDIGGIDGLVMLGDLTWSGFVKDANAIVKKGEQIQVKVLEYDQAVDPPRIRLGLKQVKGEPWDNIPETVKVGATVEGVVKSFTNFGVFVEIIPGVDGLVHVSELSWIQHIKHPSEILQIGGKTPVRVLAVDPEKRKISLSIKQTTPDPWSQVLDEYPQGSRVRGVVTGVTNFGAFVRLPTGIEGMIHRTDLTWDDTIEDLKEIIKPGDEVETCILKLDLPNRKISLGLKQTQADPWNDITQRYQKNRVLEVEIVRCAPEGAFVILEPGLEGFIALSDLARKRPARVEDAVTVGQKVRAKVTRLERKVKRVMLSVKDLLREEESADLKDFMSEQGQGGSITLGDLVENKEIAERLKQLVSRSGSPS